MFFLIQQNNNILLGDVSFSLSDFRKFVPDYPALPRGYKERRYSIENGHVLITNDDKEEFIEGRWEKAEEWFGNRFIYNTKLNHNAQSPSKEHIPGTIQNSTGIPSSEISAILKEPNFDTRRSMLQSYSLSTGDLWRIVRQERNRLLSECDWTQLPDAPLSPADQAHWGVYRTLLRNITVQQNPVEIVFPTKPS